MKKLLLLALVLALAGGGVAGWLRRQRAHDPEQQLADGIANVLSIQRRGRALEEGIAAWRSKNREARTTFFDRLHEMASRVPAEHEAFLRRILALKRPALAKRDLSDFVKENLFCVAERRCPETRRPKPSTDEAEDLAAYVAGWVEHVGDPARELEALEKALEAEGKALDARAKATLGATIEDAIERADPEAVKKIRAVLERRRPDVVEAFVAEAQQALAHRSQELQREVGRWLAEIVDAEERFHESTGAYWTGDLSCLYRRLEGGKPASRVSRRLALADAAPLAPAADCPALERTSDDEPAVYLVRSVAAKTPTDAARFAFSASPAQYGAGGRLTFLVDQTGVVWVQDLAGAPPREAPEDPAQAGWSRASHQPVRLVALADALGGDDVEAALRAADELASQGSRAAPVLARALAAEKTSTRVAGVRGVLRLSEAARAPLLPKVLELLEDEDADIRAAVAKVAPDLVAQAPESELVRLAGSSDATVRRLALDQLLARPEAAAHAADVLARALADPDLALRLRVATVLAGAGRAEGKEALVALLRSPDASVRKGAVGALASLPGNAAVLMAALSDADDAVATAAAAAIAAHVTEAKDALVAAAAKPASREPVARVLAAVPVDDSGMTDERKAFLAIASALVRPSDEREPTAVLRAYVRIVRLEAISMNEGGADEDAHARLELADAVAKLSKAAEPALVRAGADAFPLLLEGFETRRGDLPLELYEGSVAAILQKTGKSFVAPLAKLVDADPDGDHGGGHAVGILAALDKPAPEAAPALTKAAARWRGYDRQRAIATLAASGVITDEGIDAIATALDGNEEANVKVVAAQTLGSLGPRAKRAIPALERATHDDEEQVQQAANDALAAIGKAGQ